MPISNKLILVDKEDQVVGTGDKIQVHRDGILHRAFSILIMNSNREILLQKRALTKYHSGGLWSNTCCSHPNYNEHLNETVHKRLHEEMGFDCNLEFAYKFIYRAELDNDFIEYEYDHVFVGHYEGNPVINPLEAEEYKWISYQDLRKDVSTNPADYTAWFKMMVPRLSDLNVLR